MSDAPRVWTVTSTTPTRDDAVKIARVAVQERLAAGAEVTGPLVSVFWHSGELGEGEEWRLSLRCAGTVVEPLMARIAQLHPWDSPEVTATPVVRALPSYTDWVERTTARPS